MSIPGNGYMGAVASQTCRTMQLTLSVEDEAGGLGAQPRLRASGQKRASSWSRFLGRAGRRPAGGRAASEGKVSPGM